MVGFQRPQKLDHCSSGGGLLLKNSVHQINTNMCCTMFNVKVKLTVAEIDQRKLLNYAQCKSKIAEMDHWSTAQCKRKAKLQSLTNIHCTIHNVKAKLQNCPLQRLTNVHCTLQNCKIAVAEIESVTMHNVQCKTFD